MEQKISFYSDGSRLSGILFVPDSLRNGEKVPGIAVCHGYAAVKEIYLNDIARGLSKGGYATLAFDYRGFGESEGQQGRLFPMEQVEDIRNALSYLEERPEVDPHRLGLYGTSFGGGTVTYAAAIDQRVKCTVSSVGVGEGGRWLQSLWRLWEWQDFLAKLSSYRRRRNKNGKSELVELGDILPPDPETARVWAAREKAFPQAKTYITLESADATINFSPESVVEKISPRSIMYVTVTGDTLVSPEETYAMYRRAGQPKKLVVFEGKHYDVYSSLFDKVIQAALEWFNQSLKN